VDDFLEELVDDFLEELVEEASTVAVTNLKEWHKS
jgi:hypothetical protein